ncbi:MAG: hypothetical protein PHE03_09155 [Bacteroidales bacterium]|nr:hypothetical protein [Bacteroidales bacterium]
MNEIKMKSKEGEKVEPKTEVGKASHEQIEAWKKMWGEVTEIEVKGHFCYLRAFDRATLKYALSQMSLKINQETKEVDVDMSKIIDIGEVALTNCWIGGSDEIKQNDKLFIAAAMSAGQLMDFYESTLKKY